MNENTSSKKKREQKSEEHSRLRACTKSWHKHLLYKFSSDKFLIIYEIIANKEKENYKSDVTNGYIFATKDKNKKEVMKI